MPTHEPLDHELVLKTMPPRQSKTLFARERLSLHQEAFANKAFLEVLAPAGFGKTSLLGQWRREAMQEGYMVSWLTLDEREDTQRFTRGLVHALRMSLGQTKIRDGHIQKSMAGGEALAGLTAWLAEVSHIGNKTLLILDEVHLVSSEFLAGTLWYLLLNAPANLVIALGTRKALELPIAEVMTRGMYTVVDHELLRLTPSETVQALQARFGDKLPQEDCLRIHEHIAGWNLGLQLVMATLEKQARQATALSWNNHASHDFENYFQNLLATNFEAETLYFLIEVSVLDAFNAELCQAVTMNPASGRILQQLQGELPIFTEASDSDWLRLHPMARDSLRQRLKKLPQAVQQSLHQRAATWLAAHDMLESAAQHALEGQLHQMAFELMAKSLYTELTRGNQMRVLYWLERLPRGELAGYPRALMSAAWAFAESEFHARALELVDQVLARPDVTEEEKIEATVLRTAAAYFADDLELGKKCLAPIREHNIDIPLSPALRGIYHNSLALFMLYEGHPERARHLIHSTQSLSPTPIVTIHGWGEWLIGMSYLWEGQVQLAVDYLREPLARVERQLGRRAALSVKLASCLSMALWECGQVAEAGEIISGRLDVLEKVSSPESISMGYHLAAKVAAEHGQAQRALELLEHLLALGKSRQVPRYIFTSLGEQLRLHALLDHADTCTHLRDRLEDEVTAWRAPKEGLVITLLRLRLNIAFAFAHLANKEWKAMKTLMEEALPLAIRLRRGRETLEIRLLLVLAKLHMREEALPQLIETLGLAQLWGIRASLIHTHPELFNVQGALQMLRERGLIPPTGQGTWRQSPSFTTALHPESPLAKQDKRDIQHISSGGLLTSKEEEVLLLLVRNFANKQIANVMNVSPETIKWHIKNLFTKLNAGSRKHVVDRARMLGILH